MKLLDSAQQLALNVCHVKVTNPSGIHYRPKAVCQLRRKLMNILKKTRALSAQTRADTADTPLALVQDFIRQARATIPTAELKLQVQPGWVRPTTRPAHHLRSITDLWGATLGNKAGKTKLTPQGHTEENKEHKTGNCSA